jgi:hypothetical protein
MAIKVFLTRHIILFSKYSASHNMSCKHVIGFIGNKLVDIYEYLFTMWNGKKRPPFLSPSAGSDVVDRFLSISCR